MSKEAVEIAEELVEAFNRRDLTAMTEMFAPEVEWRPGGPAAVERATYRGRDEVSNGFASTWETWEVFHLDQHGIRDLGDSVLWLGRAQMRGGARHVDLDQEFAIQFRIEHGKVVEIQGFRAWQEALEAAGLSE